MSRARIGLVGLVAAVLVASTACGTDSSGDTVTVLASWTGAEGDAFQKVLDRFTAETGIEVTYQGTRGLDQVLSSDVQRGTPPDVALPSPGELVKYVRSGELRPVDGILGQNPEQAYSEQWLQLQRAGTPQMYAVAVKADLKSIVWYNPANFPGAKPQTWDELVAAGRERAASGQAPWCVGMGSPPTSGWPGTDWIEDILLHQSGSEVYQRWTAGELPWTSDEVRRAWTTWGEIVHEPGVVRGGATAALLTDFGDAGKPMFAEPQGCAMEHQASFMMSAYQGFARAGGSPVPVEDFDFFPFPGFGGGDPASRPSVVSADLAVMFNDTAPARELMKYLASERGQRVWPSIRGGSAFSVNKRLLKARSPEEEVYRDPVSKRIAETLTSAGTLCFDASDLMPATTRNAFYRAVLEYLGNPDRLDGLLTDLEQVRIGISPDDRFNFPCGR